MVREPFGILWGFLVETDEDMPPDTFALVTDPPVADVVDR